MGVGSFLRRADQAVQDTRDAVSITAVMAAAALIIASAALVVALNRR